MTDYQIVYTADPKPEDVHYLDRGLDAYATEQKGHKSLEFFGFFIHDVKNKVQGGCSGALLYGCLHVNQLYLADPLRKQGYGTQLMQAAEQLAREKNCTFLTVNTMDWEALDFYKKLGYYVEFTRKGYAKDSTFYFLRKDL